MTAFPDLTEFSQSLSGKICCDKIKHFRLNIKSQLKFLNNPLAKANMPLLTLELTQLLADLTLTMKGEKSTPSDISHVLCAISKILIFCVKRCAYFGITCLRNLKMSLEFLVNSTIRSLGISV